MPEPLSIGLAIGLKASIESAIRNIIKNVTKKIQVANQRIEDLQCLSELADRLVAVGRVKTIWQIDRPVDIDEFYCKVHALVGNERKSIDVVGDFAIAGNLIIQGIAGQGKSILLRRLCVKEAEIGNVIPIFIELRKVTHESNLKQLMSQFLNCVLHNFNTEEQLGFINRSICDGRLMLLLDGFDEVSTEMKQSLIAEIEDIAIQQPQMKIVVTSRPNSGIEFSGHFTLVRLDNLRNDEYKEIVNRLSESSDFSNRLIEQIESHRGMVSELVCTPLMVTLLVLCYKSYQEIPSQLSEFYDRLFMDLMQRHDGTKPGYQRERSCALSNQQYRDIFQAFCYESKLFKRNNFNHDTVLGIANKGIERSGVSPKPLPECFVSDIKRITCLLLEEGGEYRFIHKSVQEFFTASYISSLPEIAIKQFFSVVLEQYLAGGFFDMQWSEELRFLEQINSYAYNKFFLLPYLRKFLLRGEDYSFNGRKPGATAILAKWYQGVSLGFSSKKQGKLTMLSLDTDCALIEFLLNPLFIIKPPNSLFPLQDSIRPHVELRDDLIKIPLKNLKHFPDTRLQTLQVIRGIIDNVINTGRTAHSEVEKMEASVSRDSILSAQFP